MVILSIIIVILAIIAIVKLNLKYHNVLTEYNILEADIEGKKISLQLKDKEIKNLEQEIAMLKQEKEVAKKENVKAVEDLPKKEKVAKPRAKK